jgi:hypothetical protein
VVATVSERRLAALRRECIDQPVRRKAVRRKPPRRVSERGGGESNDPGDQRERSDDGTRSLLARLGQNPISIFHQAYQRSVWRSSENAGADGHATRSISAIAAAGFVKVPPLISGGDCR